MKLFILTYFFKSRPGWPISNFLTSYQYTTTKNVTYTTSYPYTVISSTTIWKPTTTTSVSTYKTTRTLTVSPPYPTINSSHTRDLFIWDIRVLWNFPFPIWTFHSDPDNRSLPRFQRRSVSFWLRGFEEWKLTQSRLLRPRPAQPYPCQLTQQHWPSLRKTSSPHSLASGTFQPNIQIRHGINVIPHWLLDILVLTR